MIKSNFCGPVLLNLLNSLRKSDKMLGKPLTFYGFSSTRLINSIKHEHSCKILYIQNEKDYLKWLFQCLIILCMLSIVSRIFVVYSIFSGPTFVGPDQDPNCLQSLSEVKSSNILNCNSQLKSSALSPAILF